MWIWLALGWAMATELVGQDWQVVNDTVMGGVSSGRIDVGDGVRFSGALSLAQNGGFVSIRTRPADLDLDDARAVRVRLRGDGRTWQLTLQRSDVPLRAGSYRAEIVARETETEIEVPLSAFQPASFGRPVPGAPALDAAPDRIVSVGFLLADGRPGPFLLEVLSIRPVGGGAPRGPGIEAVRATLADAVRAGVPAFNRGDTSRCRDLYRDALTPLAAHPALTPGERAVVDAALARSAAETPDRAAWTLRYAIDTLLAG